MNYFSPAYFDILMKFWFQKLFYKYDEKSSEVNSNSIEFTHSSFITTIAINIGIGICLYIQEKTGFPFFDRIVEDILNNTDTDTDTDADINTNTNTNTNIQQTNEYSEIVFIDANNMVKVEVVNTQEVPQKNLESISSLSNDTIDNINNDDLKKKQVHNNCVNDKQFLYYLSMVNDKVATWDDIIIRQKEFFEHDTIIMDIIDKYVLLEYDNDKFLLKVSMLLKNFRYSELYCSNLMEYYSKVFFEHKNYFMKNKYLFLQSDIELELNPSNDYKFKVDNAFYLFANKQTKSATVLNLFIDLMKNEGYSNNFIKYKKKIIMKRLLNICINKINN